MLNEVLNNSDITHIAKIVLNKVSNSNDAKGILNNVWLTTMGTLQFSITTI